MFQARKFTFLLLVLLGVAGLSYGQTVNIFVHKWPSGDFPSPANVQNVYSQVFTTVNVTSGLVPATGNMSQYDVLIMCELTYSGTNSILSNAQRGVVEAFVQQGGHVVWVSENSTAGNAPGSNQSLVAIQNLWGINLNRVQCNINPVVPYHGGGGPGGLSAGVASLGTTSSYDFFSGPAGLEQNCVFARSAGLNSCAHNSVMGMCFLLEEPYLCDFSGTIVIYGEVQMWSSLRTGGAYNTHYVNVAQMHEALVTGNVTALDAINQAFTPNSSCPAPTPCAVFSVDQLSFDAHLEPGNHGRLLWWTESENQNRGFEVEHAAPNDPDNFQRVGWVDGAGTTSEQQMYDFRVLNLDPGTHQFRLRVIDEAGMGDYSEIRTLEVEPQGVPTIAPTVWTTDQSEFRVYWPVEESVFISLVDLRGKEVAKIYQGALAAGTHSFAVPRELLSSGSYILRAAGATHQASERIMVY